MKKKRFSVKNLLILLFLLLLVVGAALPHFAWIVERSYAGAGLSTLVQVSVAENSYLMDHQVFTEDWQALDKRLPPDLPGKFAPVSSVSQVRMFEVAGTKEKIYFRLDLNSDHKGGFVSAQRTGLISYTLKESFPYPDFSCVGSNVAGRWFCRKFTTYTDSIMLKPQPEKQNPPSENLPEKK